MIRSLVVALISAVSFSFASAEKAISNAQPTKCSSKTIVEVVIKDGFGKKINYGSYVSGGIEFSQKAIKNLSSQNQPLPVAIYNISPQGKLTNFRSIGIAVINDSKELNVQLNKDASFEIVQKALFSSDLNEKAALLVSAPSPQKGYGDLENISSFEVDTILGKTPIIELLSSLDGNDLNKVNAATVGVPEGALISFAQIGGFNSSTLMACNCSSFFGFNCCTGFCSNSSPIGWPAKCEGPCDFNPASNCSRWNTFCSCG